MNSSIWPTAWGTGQVPNREDSARFRQRGRYGTERNAVLIRSLKSPWARAVVTLFLLVGFAASGFAKDKPGDHPKLDKTLNRRSEDSGTSRVIVTFQPGWRETDLSKFGAKLGRKLGLINARVAEIPNGWLKKLADDPAILRVDHDRPTSGLMNRAAVAIGARAVQSDMGFTGAGVGVAIIDSGTTSWHDDLTRTGTSSLIQSSGNQRVVGFVDFINHRTTQYDDNGHGTHVAGIVAGNGWDSYGARAGVAPDAHLVSLKVLDSRGRGVISDVISAFEWAVANKTLHNIRVINLSVGAAVTTSYKTDPLTLAAKRAVDAGIVVVTAAGNLGRNAQGLTQYGAITAPANAPWVLTVGAYSHQGTVSRIDDVIAPYSSRGPAAVDFEAKPDVVAPGSSIVSLSDPNSTFYTTKAANLMSGLRPTAYKPYISLSGTSMAAPMVSGTVALMMQANPNLTPNLVKAIIQYTAQIYPGYDALTQGAGFLNTRGAVDLARFYRTAHAGDRLRTSKAWSKQILWGNHRLTGGAIRPNTNAWKLSTVWGSAFDAEGDNIVWGTLLGLEKDNIVWGTFDALAEDNIVWGTLFDVNGDNIVWGTTLSAGNIVWGILGDDNIVWGTDCGGADCDNIVWGTSIVGLDDNIVWGTAEFADNIVWGTSGEVANVVWATSDEVETPAYDDPNGSVSTEIPAFEDLFPAELVDTPPDSEPPPPPPPPPADTVNNDALQGITGGL